MVYARALESEITRAFDHPSPELIEEAENSAYEKLVADDIELVETFCDLETKLLAAQLRTLLEDGADHAQAIQVIRYHLKKRLRHMCEDRVDDELAVMRDRAMESVVELAA